MISWLLRKWNNYKYRFVPWVALNMTKSGKRFVKGGAEDKVVNDAVILDTIMKLLPHLMPVGSLPTIKEVAETNTQLMERILGYSIGRGPSKLVHGGTGVFLLNGPVTKGTLIAFYPGTIYRVFEPILLPSIGNKFIFRCLDGIHIDGNDRSLSKVIYKSCVNRDSSHVYQAADLSWLTKQCIVPWNIGQYVNNHSTDYPANVAYQEVTLSLDDIPQSLHRFLPNIWYKTIDDTLRLIALVSTRSIDKGEEILSTYYNLVY